MVDVEQHFLLLNVGVRLRSARIYNSRDVEGRTVDSEYSHLVTMTRILPQSPTSDSPHCIHVFVSFEFEVYFLRSP